MNAPAYPLGHDAAELERLDAQASLLNDATLPHLAATAAHCLEIGCGTGANLSLLRSANPRLSYTGVDNAQEAIASARTRFATASSAAFHVMDAARLGFEDNSFDLVFTKLVLWSVGAQWPQVLREAYRVLKPGGVLYTLEPCNHLIQFHPEKPAAHAWMQSWDEAAAAKGLDPFIGIKVAGELHKAGFRDVQAKFHPIVALEKNAYEAVVGNLKGFYLGHGAVKFGLNSFDSLGQAARREMDFWRPGTLVMDALFAAWGTKP